MGFFAFNCSRNEQVQDISAQNCSAKTSSLDGHRNRGQIFKIFRSRLTLSSKFSQSNSDPFVSKMSSSKATTVASSERSATTTPTVGPSESLSSSTTKKDTSNKLCKLCGQDTVLAAPTVKRKGDPYYNSTVSTSTPGTSDGRKIGENKLLSKTNKTTRYPSSLMGFC